MKSFNIFAVLLLAIIATGCLANCFALNSSGRKLQQALEGGGREYGGRITGAYGSGGGVHGEGHEGGFGGNGGGHEGDYGSGDGGFEEPISHGRQYPGGQGGDEHSIGGCGRRGCSASGGGRFRPFSGMEDPHSRAWEMPDFGSSGREGYGGRGPFRTMDEPRESDMHEPRTRGDESHGAGGLGREGFGDTADIKHGSHEGGLAGTSTHQRPECEIVCETSEHKTGRCTTTTTRITIRIKDCDCLSCKPYTLI